LLQKVVFKVNFLIKIYNYDDSYIHGIVFKGKALFQWGRHFTLSVPFSTQGVSPWKEKANKKIMHFGLGVATILLQDCQVRCNKKNASKRFLFPHNNL